MNKLFSRLSRENMLLMAVLMGLCFSLLILSPTKKSYAQESQEPSTQQNELDESEPEESLLEEMLEVEVPQTPDLPFDRFIPYVQFLNYQYQGDGSTFVTQDIIMEYTPDANGVFQVAAFTENKAVAYIYQIRADGLYELAFFDNYDIVQDLRYSELALDGNDSLIVSSNLSVGSTFYSGYQNEARRTITDIIDYYVVGNTSYEGVVVIVEDSMTETDGSFKQYYLAPHYGIVSIERVYSDGNTSKVMELISTQGSLQ